MKDIPLKLKSLQIKRTDITKEIYREIKKLSESYRRLYRPVQEFVEQQDISSEAIPLSFQVSIIEDLNSTNKCND